MSRAAKRSASQAVKSGPSRPLPRFIPPQLSQPVEKPPSGLQWLHEIKLDGFRMAARIDNGRAQLLTRTGLDWTGKYPSAMAALANLNVKTAYLDGELSGVDEAGLPTFAHTQAATDGERRGEANEQKSWPLLTVACTILQRHMSELPELLLWRGVSPLWKNREGQVRRF
jgi:ATP-dependent DNA ligase